MPSADDVTALIPQTYRTALAGRDPEGPADYAVSGDDWLLRVPGIIGELLARWDLRPTGRATHGVAALVIPVRAPAGPAMLKVIWPHPEATTEHLALRRWNGHGAVRLLAADPARWGMLLEAADPGTDLQHEPIFDACETIGELLRTLAVPAMPQLPKLSDTADRYARELAGFRAIPQRMVEHAVSLCRELTADPVDATVTHTDLHFQNVLRAVRPTAEWIAIDPQAQNAEPAFAVAPVLWNRWAEAADAYSPRIHLRTRVDAVCEPAGIDPQRARGWAIVREAMNAVWAARDGDPDRVTTAVTIIKAMQG